MHVHILDVIFGDYCHMQFSLQADSLQTLPTHQNMPAILNWLAKPNEYDASVLQQDSVALTVQDHVDNSNSTLI